MYCQLIENQVMKHFSHIIFYTHPPQFFFSVWGGGLKTETGNSLLHFQNSKLSNRCWSIYSTDIKNFSALGWRSLKIFLDPHPTLLV